MNSFNFDDPMMSVGFTLRTISPPIPEKPAPQIESREYDPDWWYKCLPPEKKDRVDRARYQLSMKLYREIYGGPKYY